MHQGKLAFSRPWQIYADYAQHLIGIARPLYIDEPLGIDLDATVYAFDATTIDLCLSMYPWAPFRRAKGAIKLHTLLDLRGAIPSFISITDGKTQIWIAVCTYVLIAILKKRLKLPNSLHEILQILSLTIFETTPINHLLNSPHENSSIDFEQNQLDLL